MAAKKQDFRLLLDDTALRLHKAIVDGDLHALQQGIRAEQAALSVQQEVKELRAQVDALTPIPKPPAVILCRDCRYAVGKPRTTTSTIRLGWRKTKVETETTYDYAGALCAHPSQLSRVNGEAHEYCTVMRKTYGGYIITCGESAKWFEPRK